MNYLRTLWHNQRAFLLGIALLALVLRLGYNFAYLATYTPELDAREYSDIAASLASGRGFALADGTPTAIRPPLFPLLLAAVYTLRGRVDYQAGLVLEALLGTGIVLATCAVGRRVYGELAGRLAAIGAAIYPLLIYAGAALLSEPLFALLVMLATTAGLAALDRPTPGNHALLGLWLGLAWLARPNGLLLAVFLLGWLVIARTDVHAGCGATGNESLTPLPPSPGLEVRSPGEGGVEGVITPPLLTAALCRQERGLGGEAIFRTEAHAGRGAKAPAGENVTQAAGLSEHHQAQSGGLRYRPIFGTVASSRSNRRFRQRLVGILLAAAVTLAVISPWVVRNYLVFGQFIPSTTMAGAVLFGSNNDRILNDPALHGDWVSPCEIPGAGWTCSLDEVGRDAAWQQLGMQFIREHLADLPRLVWWRFVKFWHLYPFTHGFPENVGFYFYVAIALLAVAGTWLTRREWRRTGFPLAVIACSTASALVFWGGFRMRTPAEPALIVLAAGAVTRILSARRSSV